MKKKSLLLIPFAVSLLAAGMIVSTIKPKQSDYVDASYIASSLFDLNGITAKTASSAPFSDMYSDTRKGIKLSATNKGASALLKEKLSGVTEIDMKSSTLNSTSPNLYHYSVTYMNTLNNESFKVHVLDNGNSNTYYVEANGQIAGFYSNTGCSWSEHGMTKLYNASGKYTNVNYELAAESTKLYFDPTTVSIYVKFDKYQVKIWDFTSDYIDGKRQIQYLTEMSSYQVKFEFEECKINSKSELTIYKIGTFDFSSSFMADGSKDINADFSVKGVVGTPYKLPIPNNAETSDLRVKVYFDGEAIEDKPFNEFTTFTPEFAQSYYLVYYNEVNSGWFKLDVVNTVENNFVFETEFNEDSVGYMAKYHVPKCRIQSNLLDIDVEAVVTINKKDEAPLADYKEVNPGFDYVFDGELDGKSLAYEFTYSYKGVNENFPYTKEFEKKVLKINETVDMEEYEELYALNSTLNVHSATVYKDGNVFTPTFEVKYPSGLLKADENIVLTEPGFYEVTYKYARGSFTRTFAAVQDVNSLFINENSTGVYACSSSNDTYAGYLGTFRNNGTITYTRTINAKELTKDDTLIGVCAQPREAGVCDMTSIYVTLTDANDPSNYITVRIRQGNDNMQTGTFIRACASNQFYAGWYWNPWYNEPEKVDANKAHEMGGFAHMHDFTESFGFYSPFDLQIVKLYFDYETKALYTDWYNHANGLYPTEHPANSITKTVICDFDDKNCFDKMWNGFSSGDVILSVTATGVSGSTADLFVSDIYGADLTKEKIKDTDGPVIDIDRQGNNGLPKGVVNERFNLLNVDCDDVGSGIKEIRYHVYDPAGLEVTVSYDESQPYFVPTSTGTYVIKYEALDNFNNISEKSVSIQVVASSGYTPISMTINDVQTNYSLGETIYFPSYNVTGGVGYEKVVKEVRFNSESGQLIEHNSTFFTAASVGKYFVKYIATDYVGHVTEESFVIDVTKSAKPLFDETNMSMPLAFINGISYQFPAYEATYYSTDSIDSKQTLLGVVTVTDGAGEHVIGADGIYVPTWSEAKQNAEVKITFTYGNGLTDVYGPYTLNVVKSSSGSKFMANYFVCDNSVVNVYPRFSHVDVSDPSLGRGSTSFIRPVNERMLNVELTSSTDTQEGVTEPRINFTGFKVTFKDSLNPSIAVDVNIDVRNSGKALYAKINEDGEYVKIEGSLYSTVAATRNVKVEYDSNTHQLFDALGSLIGKVEKTVNGEQFNGFPSKEVYVSFAMENVTGPAAFKLLSVGGQSITSTTTDVVTPSLFVGENYYGTFEYGQEIVLPKAEAFDVLSYCEEPKVSVIYQDGSYCTDDSGELLNKASATSDRKFTPTKYGYYEVIYSAIDSAGNEATISRNIYIKDTEAPTFALNFTWNSNLGYMDKINVLDYTVSDNLNSSNELKVNIYIIGPDNISVGLQYTQLDGTVKTSDLLNNGVYTFDQVGYYRLLYYVTDLNGNSAVFSYSAYVK